MNLKTIKLGIFLVAIIFASSCSSDDSSENNQNETENQITFNGNSYSLSTAWINDENTTTNEPSDIGFNFFNKTTTDINSGNDLTNITAIYFDFSEVTLQEVTYSDILDYDISINGSLTNGIFSPGTILLSDDDPNSDIYASSSNVTINNLTETTVNLTFSFTRNDGQVISGSYSGNYIIPDTTD